MQIRLLAIGGRAEPWVADGFRQYTARLPRELRLELVEVPLERRTSGTDPLVARDRECERLLRQLRPTEYVVALDERGQAWSSTELAAQLGRWRMEQPDLAFVIGGPEGLAEAVRQRANRLWSLSRLTFPHGLVRILLAEQLYRAWTILEGHPYHKA